MPQPVVHSQNNVLDWSVNPVQPVANKRSSTRGGSVGAANLNQTHLNLSSFKKSNLTGSKLGNIQSILN